MAFDDLDEHEQGELVRKWLRDNAFSIVIGVVVGLSALFGYRYWQAAQLGKQAEAALQFESIAKATEAGNNEDADKIAAALRDNYPKSTYAVFAALGQAERAVNRNDLAAAATALDWAEANAGIDELKHLVALRQAQLKLANGKSDEALKQIDAAGKGSYPALVADLRGDALFQLGRTEEARTAYQDALANVDARAPQHALIQMKLDRLPAAAAPAPAATAPATPATAATPEKKGS